MSTACPPNPLLLPGSHLLRVVPLFPGPRARPLGTFLLPLVLIPRACQAQSSPLSPCLSPGSWLRTRPLPCGLHSLLPGLPVPTLPPHSPRGLHPGLTWPRCSEPPHLPPLAGSWRHCGLGPSQDPPSSLITSSDNYRANGFPQCSGSQSHFQFWKGPSPPLPSIPLPSPPLPSH